MCWQCDHPDKTQADYLDLLRAKIRAHGWAVQYVEADRTPFAYTVGLHDRGLPELLVTGLSPQPSAWLLRTFARRSLLGPKPVPGRQVSLSAGARIEPVTVTQPDAHLYMAVAIGGQGIKALQLVWADDRGRWPWAPGFAQGRGIQPVLGDRAA
jgi:hypothetical protein